MDFFLLFFSNEKRPNNPQKNPPQYSPRTLFTKIPLGFLQKPFLDNLTKKIWRIQRHPQVIEFFRARPRRGDNFTSLCQVLQTLCSKRHRHPFLLEQLQPRRGHSVKHSLTKRTNTQAYWAQQCMWNSERHSQQSCTFLQNPCPKKDLRGSRIIRLCVLLLALDL